MTIFCGTHQRTTADSGAQAVHLTARSRRIQRLWAQRTAPCKRLQQAFCLRNRRRHGCALLGPSQILLDARSKENCGRRPIIRIVQTCRAVPCMLTSIGLSFVSHFTISKSYSILDHQGITKAHTNTSPLQQLQPLHPPDLSKRATTANTRRREMRKVGDYIALFSVLHTTHNCQPPTADALVCIQHVTQHTHFAPYTTPLNLRISSRCMRTCRFMYLGYGILHIGIPSPEQQMLLAVAHAPPTHTSDTSGGYITLVDTQAAALLCCRLIVLLRDHSTSRCTIHAPRPFPTQSTRSVALSLHCICLPHQTGTLYMMVRRGCPANESHEVCVITTTSREARKLSANTEPRSLTIGAHSRFRMIPYGGLARTRGKISLRPPY